MKNISNNKTFLEMKEELIIYVFLIYMFLIKFYLLLTGGFKKNSFLSVIQVYYSPVSS